VTITTENQAVIPVHKWQGIASSIIGLTSIIFNLLLVGLILSGTELPRPMSTALPMLSNGMLCVNLIGIALGFFGAQDSSSRKRYPLFGLTLNVAILTALLVLALVGLSTKAP
jgi:hypothetical protein